MTRKIIKIVFFILFSSVCSYSQTVSENRIYNTEEILVEGYRVNTDVVTAPTKIKIINSEEIKNKNGSRLSDIVNLSGNIYVKSYGGNSTLKTVSQNGLSAEHTVILIDGVKLNSFQNSQVDLSLIPKDNIDKIEIINNGLGSVYGSEAVGGVINIITDNSLINGSTGIILSGQYGSYGFKKHYAGLTEKVNNFTFSSSLNYETSADNFEYYYSDGFDRNLQRRDNSEYSFLNLNFGTNYKINDRSNLKIYSNYSTSRKNIPGIVTGSPDSKSSQQDNNWANYLTYENNINSSVTIKTILSFQNNFSRFEAMTLARSFFRNISLASSSQIKLKKLSGLTLGYDLVYGKLHSNDLEIFPERIQAGLYVINSIKPLISESLIVYPSLRYDYYSDTKINNICAGIGINYNVLGKNILYIKSHIGNNFRMPSFNDLYWKTGGNKNLSQERSLNYNVGLILNFDLFSRNSVDINYSYNKISNKIVWIPDISGFWTPENVGKNNVHNLNFELKTEKYLTESLKYYYDVTFNYCRNMNLLNSMNFEKLQMYVPEISFKISTGMSISGFNFNLFYQYFSKRYTDLENDYFLPSVRLLDGNIGWKMKLMGINLNIRLEVNNIMNEDYQLLSGYPMPLRNYKICFELNY